MTNLTCQAREEAPFLKKFANDWPTQALAMQLLKNKRGYSYRRGYLEVPNKFAYLKDNAAKKTPHEGRDASQLNASEDPEDGPTHSGGSNGTSGVVASGSKSKRAAPVTMATQQPQKKKKGVDTTITRARPTAKGKGKQKARLIEVEPEPESEDIDKDEDKEETELEDSDVDSQGDDADVADPEE
jgi:hypothetical protein